MTAPDPQRGATTAPGSAPEDALTAPASMSHDGFLFPRAVRPFALAAGFLLTGIGILGTILPLMPGTIFLIAAAWLFARSSPRFEAWLLALPMVGPLVEDFRRGAGMPLQAKWLACASIVIAVTLSLGRIPVLIGQIAWILIGVAGVWYITQRVPTKLS